MKQLLLITLILFGQNLFGSDSYKPSNKKKIYSKLGLSHNQAKSMFVINRKKKIKIKHLRKALREVQKRINALLLNDGVEEEIRLWHKKKIIIQAKIKQEKFMSNMRIRRLLSKKQRSKYLKIKRKIVARKKSKLSI